jgi:hypothetical protein
MQIICIHTDAHARAHAHTHTHTHTQSGGSVCLQGNVMGTFIGMSETHDVIEAQPCCDVVA